MSIPLLPTFNATMNACSFVLVVAGWRRIKKGDETGHRRFMVAAVCFSVLFLTGYLTYHAQAGLTRYQGQGLVRTLYFAVLATHTPLAALVAPFIAVAVYFAVKGKREAHKRVTRWLLPGWLYVSFTGVVIYAMLYLFPPA